MSNSSNHGLSLPPEQEAIRAKSFHPSGTFVEFPKEDVEKSIPERFEKVVTRFPDHLAIKSEDQTLTYSQVNSAANRVAHAILSRCGRRQRPVALFLERGAPLIIANLAVLKAGMIAMQVDPGAPRDRIAHILADSRTALLLSDAKSRSSASLWVKEGRKLLELEMLDAKHPSENLQLPILPSSYASITYTSGSTGKAKGAAKTHGSILHVVMNFTNLCRICADDRLAVFGRGAIGKHLFNGLLNGATHCLFDLRQGSVQLSDKLIQNRITILATLPTALRTLVYGLSAEKRFPRLRLLRLSGEPVVKADLELYKRHFPPECILVNAYAAQETGDICFYFADQSTAINDNHVPVGFPTEGAEVFVVDDLGKKAAPGQTGEIVVRSGFLNRRYWRGKSKLPKTSLARTKRTYRTGDVGRMSKDGCLVHVGRKDFRVKIRSFRVDVGEVEATLADHPDAKQVAVVAKELPSRDATLVAYLVFHRQPAPTVTSLRQFLNGRLPEYMIPSLFVTLERFPLTATGKVDRLSLPDPASIRPKQDQPYTEPSTEIERELVKIWSEVLSVQNVGIHDGFFDLGGQSLLAMRVVSQVLQKFHLELPVQSLFLSPTIAEMAAVITRNLTKFANEAELAAMLHEVEAMSEEEARKQMAMEARAIPTSVKHE